MNNSAKRENGHLKLQGKPRLSTKQGTHSRQINPGRGISTDCVIIRQKLIKYDHIQLTIFPERDMNGQFILTKTTEESNCTEIPQKKVPSSLKRVREQGEIRF